MSDKNKEIIARIQELYPNAGVEINGEDCSLEILVSSEAFSGMPLLKRQKSILALFADDIKNGKLHAIGVKAKTPQEWEAIQSSNNLLQISG